MKHAAFLRAINVSPRFVKIKDLVALYEKMGFQNIQSYVQSGNFWFDSPQSATELKPLIEKRLHKTCGFDVPVVLRSLANLKTLKKNRPFPASYEGRFVHIAFLDTAPKTVKKKELLEFALAKASDDQIVFARGSKEIYLYFSGGAHKSKLSNKKIESTLGVTSTLRNWNTLEKMIELGCK